MNVLESAIGWLAPPQCLNCGDEGSVLCKTCSTSVILPFGQRCWQCAQVSFGSRTCERCRRQGSPRSVWITTVYEGLARQLVREYKFKHSRAAVQSLTDLMTATLWAINDKNDLLTSDYLVVPIPTASSRVRQRGFDQTGLLARKIARQTSFLAVPALGRLGQESQVGAQRAVRLAQPAGKYFVRRPGQVANRSILLIDDVLTTGATLREATRVLKLAGAKQVDALVFSKRL